MIPRNISEELGENPGLEGAYFQGGFKSDEERNFAMTKVSNFDIAFVKNNRWDSGTT